MVRSFGNKLAEDLFINHTSRETRRFPSELHRAARRKLAYLHDAGALADLKVPPGNRLEKLRGDLAQFHSIRINDQWRVIFRWERSDAFEVQVLDYHRG